MIKNKFIVVPFLLPWDWSADYQRQTVLLLARKNRIIAYMQKDAIFFLKLLFRNKKTYPRIKNVNFYTPIYILPFRKFSQIERLNQIISFKIFLWFTRGHTLYNTSHYKEKILWIFDPDFHFYPKLAKFFLTLYDCVDYHWSPDEENLKKIRTNEKKLIKAVNLFVVNSNALYKVHVKVRRADKVVPQGFRIQDFGIKHKPSLRFPTDKPTIGLAGAINERLNLNLLGKLIKNNPQWSFVLWGPRQETGYKDPVKTKKILKKLFSLPNVFRGQLKTPNKVPAIVEQFTIAMIPYNTGQNFNKYCYPMKLFEYFYLGKPVISSPIEELKRFPKYVKIGHTVNEWEKHIKFLLSKPWPKAYQNEQRKLAEENSWKSKIEVISKIIDDDKKS